MYTQDPSSSQHAPRRGSAAGPALAITGVLGAMLAMVLLRGGPLHSADPAAATPRPVVARGDLAEDEKTTIELFERCSASVVYVSPVERRRLLTMWGVRDFIETGTGSGFVWDKQGHVVTNYHVIEGADSCGVTLPDGSTYDARLVSSWQDKDIAVLRIDAPPDKLIPIAVGTSKNLRVGQKVFAIGNPYGLDFTLTTGVVSALNRQIESVNGRTIQRVIQTDAAINPGSSGGPLLDSAGRLIGMNTSIISRSGASAGIGFAVPVDTINRVVSQIIAHGKVIRPGLGIEPNDWIPRRLGHEGVLVLSVAEGSAAERAGLRPAMVTRDGKIVGDYIVKVADTPTPNLDALLNALEKYEIGQTVNVTIQRNGRTKTIPVTLQAID